MNLQTRRLAEREFEVWSQEPGRKVWVYRIMDRFGDYGLTGLASLEVRGNEASIVDFL